LFHQPKLQPSVRALALLKQISAEASETATEDQASDHSHQNKIQRAEFELDIQEEPPTGDQLRSILEYAGINKAKEIVEGSHDVNDAVKRLQEDHKRFRAPVVSAANGDWSFNELMFIRLWIGTTAKLVGHPFQDIGVTNITGSHWRQRV
jgi:hypothetical protein